MALKVWILFNIIAFSHSFLFDVTTNKPSTFTISKNQYDDLLKMLMQEHSDRVQLQGIVEEQKREIIQHRTALMELNSRLKRIEGTTAPTSPSVQTDSCRELEQKFKSLSHQHLDLTHNYSSLYQEHKVLANELITEKKKTAKLEKDVIALAIISDQLLADANRTSALEIDLAALKQSQTIASQNLNHLRTELASLKTPAGFTAVGFVDDARMGSTIRFPKVVSSYGFQGLDSFNSSGIFRVDTAGTYLIIAAFAIEATEQTLVFNIYKNNQPTTNVGQYGINRPKTSEAKHSSSTVSLVLHFSVGDLVHVRLEEDGYRLFLVLSSLTVVKIN